MLTKPTIFVFTTAYHPFIGGAEIAIQEVARRLAGEFRFFIVTARMRRDLPKREVRPEGTVIRVGFGTPFDKWLLPFAGPCAFFRERGGARAILWGVDISAGSLAAAFVKFLSPKTPFVFTIQYGYGGERLRKGRLGAVGKAFSWMLGRADAVTAISKYLAAEAAAFGYSRPVELLPNGVSLDAFLRTSARTERNGPPIVITTSRLVPKNGVDVLVRAVAEIRKSRPDIRCHILGDGPERSSLEALARSLGVASNVIFLGDVANSEVPRHLAAADVFVRPSRSEGMGNAFVEALAAGLPVVGTPVEGILDIIEDGKTGLFVRVDDPVDVAEKILRILGDHALARRIADAGAITVRERFSWDIIARGYIGVFHNALLPRVLIATPMLPPDVGGPGAYAERLAGELAQRGRHVSVLCYASAPAERLPGVAAQVSVPLRMPAPLRMLRFGVAAWRMLRSCDIALAFDPVAVGRPLAIACRMRGRPFVIRVEGDALWERYVERTGEELILQKFSGQLPRLRLTVRERAWRRMSRKVFLRARRIVFSSRWRKEIFKLGNPLRLDQEAIIAAPYPRQGQRAGERDRTFVFAGRLVRVKNLRRLIRAFAAAAPADMRLEFIGDGPERKNLESGIQNLGLNGRVFIRPPLAPTALRERITRAHAFVLPSLSDVSPNVILDCIAVGTPFLLTGETGFYEIFKDIGVFVDPLDEDDIAAKLRMLMDPRSYRASCERLAKFSGARPWETVVGEWLDLVRASV